jgi:hypothetical protein
MTTGFNIQTAADMHANVQNAKNIPASLKTQLTTQASPAQVQATQADALQGMQAVAAGGKMSDEQIKSGFALASAGGLALASGMSMSAAMPIMLPIAVVVFGAGAAGAALIEGALGMHAHSTQTYTCTEKDKKDNPRGSNPLDPRWVHALKPHLYDNNQGNDSNARPWKPATNGKFETWTRPILMLAGDMMGNCLPVPGMKGVSDDTMKHAMDTGQTLPWQVEEEGNFALWCLGLIKVWNDSNPGAPMRKITMVTSGPDMTKIAHGELAMDPIQGMLWQFRRTLKQYNTQYKSGAPITIDVAEPLPAHVVKKTVALHLGPVTKVPPAHLASATIVPHPVLPKAPAQAVVPSVSTASVTAKGKSPLLAMAGGAAAGFFVAGPIGAAFGAAIGWGANKVLAK